MNKKTNIVSVFVTILATFPLFAQDAVDENAMFADSSSVVDSARVVNTKKASESLGEKQTVGWSGEVNAYAIPTLSRSWFTEPHADSIGFSSLMVANGLFDARLVGGMKAYADLELSYAPVATINPLQTGGELRPDSGAQFALREMFVDANYKKLVYVRAGKQVLQWGPCFLWNPTDLVNVEKKPFFQKMGHREGTYGIKVHVPYKTLFNFYSFIDANNAKTFTDLAAAAKAEFLLGRTETALSLWGKRNRDPVFGWDFSTQLCNVQIAGEVSIRNGKDMRTLDLNDTVITDLGNSWIPRASLNLMKFFPLNGVADRLMVSTEFYYNQAGYDPNIFSGGLIDYQRIIATLLMKGNSIENIINLYEPNSYSTYYGMVTTSISRFILDAMTFSCSAVGNLNQNCYMISTGVDYQSLHNFDLALYLNGFVGDKNTEYTFTNSGLVVQVKAGIIF